uniref:Uncharacterized protein n=1 Tax=Rhizophora mucronata TaxID=61149 RepID=A0A2P2QQM9_RHIMU
MLTTKFWHTIK